MTNPVASLAKSTSQVSFSLLGVPPVTAPAASPSPENPSHNIEVLEIQVQGLREELAGAHGIIGQQLRELQFLRRALHHVGVETVRVVLKAQAFRNDHGSLSPTSVVEDESSLSLNFSPASTSKTFALDPQAKEGNLRTMSLSSDASCESLHPTRVQFRRLAGSTQPRLSSVSISSEGATHLQIDGAASATAFLSQTTADKTVHHVSPRMAAARGRLSTNKSNLPSTPERPCMEMTDGMNTDEDTETLVEDQVSFEAASVDLVRQDRSLIAQGDKFHKNDFTIVKPLVEESCCPHDQEVSRPPSQAESQVTTKASNTSSLPILDNLRQRRKNFLAKASPTVVASEYHQRTTHILKPPERMASPIPIPRISSPSPQETDPTVKVEGKLLADAWGQGGVYTGSIDSTTGLPHGHGTIIYKNVSLTSISTATAHKYSGDWKQGKYHGTGTLQEAGHTYQGPFDNGAKHGSDDATMTFTNGRRFIGRFRADSMREGILQYEDGSYYEGLLKNNKRNGFGFYRFSSGDQYEGLWKNDMMHGQGRMEWTTEGNHYNGEWSNGLQHGIGLDTDRHGNILHQGHYFEGTPLPQSGPIAV